MTWEAGGVDAVLGAGGGVWHLRLPPTYSDGSATISATTSVVDIEASLTPTVARIWPGGKVVNG